MTKTLQAVCAALVLASLAPAARAFDDCQKNHYILDAPIPRCQWHLAAPMLMSRAGHTATLLHDGRVLVAGGANFDLNAGIDDPHADAEIYDPRTKAWTATAPMQLSRRAHTATLLDDGRVLVVGGDRFGNQPPWLPGSTAEIFDPATGEWTEAAAPLSARVAFTATALADGRVLVVGGIGAYDQAIASTEIFDPKSGRWARTDDLRGARFSHAATALADGRVLVVAGSSDDMFEEHLDTAEIYDPQLGAWSSAGRIEGTRVSHQATLLDDGRVLVSGGYHLSGYGSAFREPAVLATASIYDADLGEWSDAQSLRGGRFGHTATALRGGGVLLIGGNSMTRPEKTIDSTALFDPLAETWSRRGTLQQPRAAHTATQLLDGTILVTGGYVSSRTVTAGQLNTTEIYR